MNELLRALYDTFYKRPPEIERNREIESYHQQLIDTLDKPSRRMVLRIIDAKDQIIDDTSVDSFVAGFDLAYQLCREIAAYRQRGRLGDPDEC